jgi:glutathione S-transferase
LDELYVMHHATCARKALITLAEKGAPVGTRELDRMYLRTPEYRRLNPEGVVPTLVLADGGAMVESSIIMRYLDEAYEGPALQPTDALARADMNLWLKVVDEKVFPALGAITAATFIRSMFGDPLDEARLTGMLDAMIDYPARLMRERCVREGVGSPFVVAGLKVLRAMLDRVEAALGQQPWLAGDTLTLADCAMMPIMLRLDEFGLSPAWTQRLPHTTEWWNRLASRPSTERILAMADKALLAELIATVEPAREGYLQALS